MFSAPPGATCTELITHTRNHRRNEFLLDFRGSLDYTKCSGNAPWALGDGRAVPLMLELKRAAEHLDHCGFATRPSWEDLKAGARPPPSLGIEPGEWQHGWQFHASSISEHHFRETMVLRQSCAADQAHLRSHAGPESDAPTQPEFAVCPEPDASR